MPTPASPLPIRDDAAFDRRAVLGLAASGAALLAAGPAQAQGFTAGAIQAALGEGQKFNPSTVIELARLLSKRPYNPPSSELPDPFNNLPYDQYVTIRAQPNAVLWNQEGRGFTVEPHHAESDELLQVTARKLGHMRRKRAIDPLAMLRGRDRKSPQLGLGRRIRIQRLFCLVAQGVGRYNGLDQFQESRA
jgi:hypothetical protein